LKPEVRKQAEEKLKRPIPNPDDPEFYRLLEELRANDPDLAALLEEGIEFQTVKPPEEEVKGEVRKRSLMRNLFNRLFMRYDELSGEWVPSRPKQIMVFTLVLMGPFILMWGLNALSGRPKATPAPQAASPAAGPGGGEVSAAPPPQSAGGAEALPPPPAAVQASPQAAQGEAAWTPGEAEGAEGGGGQSAPSEEGIPPPPLPPAYSDVPPPPQTATGGFQEVAASSMAAYAPAPQAGLQVQPMAAYLRPVGGEGQVQGGLSVYVRPTGGEAQGQGQGPSMAVPVSSQPAQGGGLSVYTGQALAQTQVAPVSSFVAYRPEQALPQPVPAFQPPQPQAQAGGANLPGIFDHVLSGAGAPSGQTGAGAQPSPMGGQAQAAQPSLPYLPGTQVSGRLAVRLIVPEGQEVPAAVEAEDGTTFLGRAKLSPTRRLEITLDQAVAAGKVYGIRAVVLGKDRAQGLPAQVREEAPSLVADLVRGSLRGLSDYVRARSQATTITTTPTGTTIQQGQAPPLELFLGAAAADLFSVPEGTKAVVRVAEVREGEPLFVLFLGGAQ